MYITGITDDNNEIANPETHEKMRKVICSCCICNGNEGITINASERNPPNADPALVCSINIHGGPHAVLQSSPSSPLLIPALQTVLPLPLFRLLRRSLLRLGTSVNPPGLPLAISTLR